MLFMLHDFVCTACAAAACPTEEEYVLLADYVTDIEGELSVSAGDVVQLVNREATGIAIEPISYYK